MRVCHVYGWLPEQVLSMTYSHFMLCVRSIERLEAERAFFTALAFNDPQKLGTIISASGRPKKPAAFDVNDFLKTVNGR